MRRPGKSLDEMEKAHILRVLEECGGNQTRAAEILDIDRVTLHHKLKRYGWTSHSPWKAGTRIDASWLHESVHLLPVGNIDFASGGFVRVRFPGACP